MQTRVRRIASVAAAVVVGAAALAGAQQAYAAIHTHAIAPTIQADLGAKRVVVKRSQTTTYVTGDGAWHQLTTQKITIPAGQKGLVIARFAGSAYCHSQSASCWMRMFIDGNRMYPAQDTLGAAIAPSASWGNQSMETSYGGLGPGEHQVKIEILPADAIGVTSWSLSLEYWRQS